MEMSVVRQTIIFKIGVVNMSNRIFKVSCSKVLGTHVGLYIESARQVFHNSPGRGEHLSTLDEFSEGKQITFEEVNSINYQTVVNRINSSLANPQNYDLVKFNCEDSVYKILETNPHSPQRELVEDVFKAIVVMAAIIVFAIGVAGLIVDSTKNGA